MHPLHKALIVTVLFLLFAGEFARELLPGRPQPTPSITLDIGHGLELALGRLAR